MVPEQEELSREPGKQWEQAGVIRQITRDTSGSSVFDLSSRAEGAGRLPLGKAVPEGCVCCVPGCAVSLLKFGFPFPESDYAQISELFVLCLAALGNFPPIQKAFGTEVSLKRKDFLSLPTHSPSRFRV